MDVTCAFPGTNHQRQSGISTQDLFSNHIAQTKHSSRKGLRILRQAELPFLQVSYGIRPNLDHPRQGLGRVLHGAGDINLVWIPEEEITMKRTALRTSAIALGVAAALPATAQEWNLAWGGFMNQHVVFGSTETKTTVNFNDLSHTFYREYGCR